MESSRADKGAQALPVQEVNGGQKKRNITGWLHGLKLQTRMFLYSVLMIVPFFALTLYLLFNLNGIAGFYSTAVQNITKVNAYNLVFKEEMDSVMYMMVAHSLTKYDVGPQLNLTSPDAMIREAEEAFEAVRATTVSEDALESISRATKLLTTLHKRVNDISSTVRVTGHYDENMESLDVDIYVLTEMIQERISEYIYYESVSMESRRETMDQRRMVLVRFAILTALALLVLAFLFTSAISRSIIRPIGDLMKAAGKLGAGNFEARASQMGSPEIRTLSESFNSMAQQIGDLVEKNRQEQINLRNLELKLLQAQIDPHFLYNTLDNIIWLAEDDRKEDVEGIATALSTFFRTALSGGHDVIPIREEERHIRSYLEIQQFRYRDMLTYSIDIAPDCLDCQILKMTLQPVVENALYHGIKNKRGGGHIAITGAREENQIRLCVHDTGIGMTPEQLTELVRMVDGGKSGQSQGKNRHFGLSNVAERLRLNYDESFGLLFDSRYGEGTKVEIVIPVREYGVTAQQVEALAAETVRK